MEYSVHNGNARRDERVSLDALVELWREGSDEALQADAVDISPGGLSLRAAFVPDLGARLSCRFRCQPGGEPVRALGEVIWADWDGYREGSFGVRFLELDARSAQAICGFTQPAGSQGTTVIAGPARLRIDGLDAAIEADVRLCERDCIVLEQELTFLRLGRNLELELPGQGRRRGRIGSITLRNGPLDVPTLVFGVLVDGAAAADAGFTASEAKWFRTSGAGQGGPALADETHPDGLPLHGVALDDPFAPQDAGLAAARQARPRVASRAQPAGFAWCEDAPPAGEAGSAGAPQPALVEHMEPEESQLFSGTAEPRVDADDLLASLRVAGGAMIEGLARAIRRLIVLVRAISGRGSGQGRGWLGDALLAVARLRGLAHQRWAALRNRARRRRTTTAPSRVQRSAAPRGGQQRASSAARPRNRRLAAGALALVGVGLGIYALAPASGASRLAGPQGKAADEPEAVVVSGAFDVATDTANPSVAAAPSVAQSGDSARPSERPSAAPSMPEPAADATPAPRFGAEQVPSSRTFALRMSGPVRELSGEARDDGFTVRVPGRLSLDRASPIAISHAAIARAMILNRGDYAELTVDFVPGMQPKYAVQGKGDTIEVILERL